MKPEPLGNYDLPKEPEWLLLANAGIVTKTEIPKIIPPLPKGDTEDLNVWKEYWKNHDVAVAKKEHDRVLNKLKTDLEKRFITSNNQWSKGRNSGLIECCNIIDEYLQTQGEQP